jgi:NADP-dependent 3-hydroxy acid dehydrogenase YdfG
MRILLIGSTGLLGSALVTALGPEGKGHEILEASRNARFKVDIREPESIRQLYHEVGTVDAVACAAGSAPMRELQELELSDFMAGVEDKLLGQIELVRQGLHYVSDGGSFTLISGITAYEPIKGGTVLSTVNSAVDGFVRGAAVEMPRGLRINSVSATIFEEAVKAYGASFPGSVPVSTSVVAQAFVKSIEGVHTGQTYRVGF